MGIELGRISGPLLAENLLRNGIDLAFEDNLLYLDVNNNRIGIRKDNPGYTLDITGTTDTPYLIVDTSAGIGNLVFNTNLIQNVSGPINIVPNQTTDPVITATQFGTLNLRISDRVIENITNGSNINISPNGIGKVVFNTNKVNVDGDLHATGDITWDGSITFGDSGTDNIAITSLINSDLIPKTNLTYNLGSVTNKWKEVNLENLTATNIVTNGITAFGINLTLRVGHTWYVSKNGLDTNYGDHLHATFLTIKQALSVAEPGDEIVIFPGVYEEIFPLLVPANVTVHGDSIRAVTITPTVLTKSNDAFLLNSGATVENLTVKDYYYNSLADTGYAFRLASGYLFNGKSPYVRNISVITSSSGVDLAGCGALVDGSVVNTSSTEASMLFHSVTFITPEAKALVMTNGVRVEWLNSFTYFASVGIELTNGTLGRAGLGVKFGGEIRSINSANVYGDYGITANGNSTLAYLIGHNFGYIGSGLDSTNDPKNVIQANEVIETNGGKIYYESVDNKGDVRIGNIFYVSQETGQVSFDASAINFASDGSIILEGPTSSTYIQASYVQTGNIRLHDNTVESLAGPVNLTAQTGSTYLNTDVFVTGNLSITKNVKVKGNVYLGDTPFDLITIVPDLTQNINPDVTDSFTLGTDNKRWNNLFIKLVNVDNVTALTNNTISTLTTDTDLKFVAAGSGEIHVATTNVQISNDLTVNANLTVNGATSLKDTEIGTVGTPKTLTHVGNLNQTGDTYITGLFANNNISGIASGYLSTSDIKIDNNSISVLSTDNDLNIAGETTGGVVVDNQLKILDNVISNVRSGATTDSQKSILLSPNGAGNTVINSTKSLVIPVGNNTTRTMTTGEIRFNNLTRLYEGAISSGLVSFFNIYDSDRNTYITPELTLGANDNTIRFGVNGVVKATITPTALVTPTYNIDNVSVNSNVISSVDSSTDLNIVTTDAGNIVINSLPINNSTIINTTDSALVLQSTVTSSGNGYIKFGGKAAVVIPTGPTEARRQTPELGETRYNTTLDYLEVFDGTNWVAAAGGDEPATLGYIEETLNLWSIVLG
jgi:hypothetical protein